MTTREFAKLLTARARLRNARGHLRSLRLPGPQALVDRAIAEVEAAIERESGGGSG